MNLTTPLSTISVGIDDGSDLVDNVVSTSIEGADGNTREAKDRLGGGEYSENWLGLNPSESVSDATAALGNFVARSMSQPTNDDDINIVVTGDSGPISLTGKLNLEAGDPGTTGDVDPGGITAADYCDETGAAIAIGGSLQGAISIPGTIDTADSDTEPDILIGIAVDADNDGDYKAGEEPSGSVNAPITIGHAPTTNIVVADDINYDIVVTGYDWHLEESGMDAGGDLNGVKANGDIGQLGEDVIVVAGGLEYVIADGSLNSGIFSGGDGADSVEIEGTTINGPIVLGAVYGIDSLLIIDHEAFGDVGDSDTISGAQMTIQIAAGGIGDGTDAVGDIYVQDSISSINVSTSSGDAIDIGNIFTLDDGSFWVSTPADMGVIVAAEGVNILTSEQLQDLITTTDVVNSPTTLDTANGDDDDYLAYSGYIDAVNAGGVVAEGDIDISDAEILENMGYIVSLHSYIDACVYAGTSIGSIVSSDGIYDSYFESEGTLGVGLGTLAADFGTGGYAESLAGFPDWFLGTGGGVVSEVADIDSSDFIAHGGFEFTGGEGVAAAQAMGTFYVVAGNIDCDSSIISGGSMGGIQAPTGVADMLFQVSMDGNIDRIIVAQWSPASNSNPTLDSYWNSDRVAIFVHGEAGDNIIVASNPLTIDSIDISVTGANTLAIYNSSNDIVLVGGLELGSSLVVNGDIPGGDLVVDGNWAGLVDINPNAETGERGENAIITVTGSVLAGADLDCFNFVSLNVQGTIDSSVLNGGTLSSSNRTDSLTMLDDTSVQTLYLRGASNVTAVWNSVFGKVTGYTASGVSVNGVEFMGKGKADFATDSGSSAISESAMQDFVKAGSVSQGTAHIGDMSLALGSKVNLKNALVPGELDSFTTPNNARNLIVGDNVGTVSVGNVLNNAFIGGNVDDFGARIAKNVVINGSVDDFSAYKITKTSVFGVTDDLTITGNRPRGEGACGSIINSFFLWVNDANFGPTYPQSNVRIVKSVIGGLDEVPDTVYIPWYYS